MVERLERYTNWTIQSASTFKKTDHTIEFEPEFAPDGASVILQNGSLFVALALVHLNESVPAVV